MDFLAERALKNEAARDPHVGKPSYGGRPRRGGPQLPKSVFVRSLTQERHPLDRRFRCGFDPHNVSIKAYRMHITNCKDGECIGRHLRWLDLMEYFRK